MYKAKLKNYEFLHPNKEEFRTLKKEIFDQEIYSIDLETDTPIIFDIGAYIGVSVMYFKDQYPNSTIFAFEPNPEAFKYLEQNAYGEGIELVNTAIGKVEDNKKFYIDNTGKEWNSTAGFIQNAWNGKQEMTETKVKVEKLSKYLSREIDLIKIDTEGNEIEILEEIEPKLHLIRNLVIEYHPTNDHSIKRLLKILKRNNFNYKLFLEDKEIISPQEELMVIKATRS